MKKIIVVLGMVALLAGCAATKQAIQDYQTGRTTPVQANEVTPATKAAEIAGPISALPVPFAPAAGAAVTFLATLFFTWQRGASIRKTGAPAPDTTSTSNVPHIVQDIANVAAGAFTMINNGSLTGSVIQRAWKVALATATSGVAVAAADPTVASFLGAHPIMDASFVAISAGIAALEKGLSSVPAPATAAPVAGA